MTIRLFASRSTHRSAESSAPALEQQLAAMEVIDRLTADQSELAAAYQAAVQWATDAELVFACVDRENQALRAENEHLRARLTAAAPQQRAVARVIPLQQRHASGPDAA